MSHCCAHSLLFVAFPEQNIPNIDYLLIIYRLRCEICKQKKRGDRLVPFVDFIVNLEKLEQGNQFHQQC